MIALQISLSNIKDLVRKLETKEKDFVKSIRWTISSLLSLFVAFYTLSTNWNRLAPI